MGGFHENAKSMNRLSLFVHKRALSLFQTNMGATVCKYMSTGQLCTLLIGLLFMVSTGPVHGVDICITEAAQTRKINCYGKDLRNIRPEDISSAVSVVLDSLVLSVTLLLSLLLSF